MVEDEPAVARYVGRVFAPMFETVGARTVADGVAAVDRGTWAGAVIDIRLPDGSGLDVLRHLRRTAPLTPAMVLTADQDPDIINAVQRLRAEFVCKPDCTDNLRDFARRVAIARTSSERDSRFRAAIDAFAERFSLSPRESQIVSLATDGVPRGHIADVIGVSENTIKTQIRSLLTKANCNSLSDAVWLVRSYDADATEAEEAAAPVIEQAAQDSERL